MRGEAAELRFRDGLAVLSDPGCTPGARLAHDSHLYRESRRSADAAQQTMAEVARLDPADAALGAKLGFGSHAYRIGGPRAHARDRRLVALDALKEQRRKNWFKKDGGAAEGP